MLLQPRSTEDDTHSGVGPSAIYSVAIMVVIGFSLSALQKGLSGQISVVLRQLPMIGAAVTACVLVYFGRTRAAKAVLFSSLLGGAGLLVSTARLGIFDSSNLLFAACIVIGALLFTARAYVLSASAVLVSIAGLGWLQSVGLIGRQSPLSLRLSDMIDMLLVYTATAVIAGFLSNALRRSLARALHRKHMLAQTNHELEHQTSMLRQSEERMRSIIELAVDAIVFCNRDGIIAEANHQAQVLSGAPREQLQGTHIRDYFTPEELDDNPLRFDLLLQGKSVTKERNLLRQDGTSIPVEMRSKMMPDGSFHTFIRDIRHRRRVEEQMAKQQRLESLGLLAGGIAHDFNNLLTGVYGCIELARASLPEHLDIQESVSLLTDARVSIDRARDLSNQLLTFSRGGAPAKSLCSLREPVKRCLKLSLAGSGVRSQVTIPDNLWPCEIDRGQISQVISNILINALQAMSDTGTIAVTCRNTLLKPDNSLLLEPGAYVAVEIEDSGEGIPPEILPRVFDPFVTTKPNGSGLGLAISHSIVKRHGGHIGVTSAFESGTRFTIHLPAAPDKTASPDSPLLFAAETSKRKILVVDDDETVLNVFRRLLEHAGYEAATAASGSTAVKLYTEHRESEKPFDLVILDLTIRGEKGGVEILGQLKAVDPTVVAIATSGYSNDPVMADPASFGFAATLAKPFEAEMLIRKLQSLPAAP